MRLRIKKLCDVQLPRKANEHAAGIDFHSPIDADLPPGGRLRLRLGVALEVPPGWCLCLCNRSGMVRNGVYVTWGVIDSDYRGEVIVELRNLGVETYEVGAGDRVCQGVFLYVPYLEIVEEKDALSVTSRGENGFGSTGR